METKKVIFAVLIFIFSSSAYAQQLVELWRTGPVMKTPESALYSPQHGVIFVANINGEPTAKDGNGFISQLSPDGSVKKNAWVAGMNAPKGMAICKEKLYVSDIDELVEIDIPSQKIVNRYPAPGAIFLNDVAATPDGRIFVSDSRTNKIHLLENGNFIVWLSNDQLKNINGLLVENDKLFVGSDNLQCVDIPSKEIETIQTRCGGIDGLDKDNEGNFVFSNWEGRIFYLEDGKKIKMIETAPEKINSADISFAPAINLLLVPTFYSNEVVAYKIEK